MKKPRARIADLIASLSRQGIILRKEADNQSERALSPTRICVSGGACCLKGDDTTCSPTGLLGSRELPEGARLDYHFLREKSGAIFRLWTYDSTKGGGKH